MSKLTADQMRKTVRKYYDGCNEGDVTRLRSAGLPRELTISRPECTKARFVEPKR